MDTAQKLKLDQNKNDPQIAKDAPEVIEEIIIEELSIDGICGVY